MTDREPRTWLTVRQRQPYGFNLSKTNEISSLQEAEVFAAVIAARAVDRRTTARSSRSTRSPGLGLIVPCGMMDGGCSIHRSASATRSRRGVGTGSRR